MKILLINCLFNPYQLYFPLILRNIIGIYITQTLKNKGLDISTYNALFKGLLTFKFRTLTSQLT